VKFNFEAVHGRGRTDTGSHSVVVYEVRTKWVRGRLLRSNVRSFSIADLQTLIWPLFLAFLLDSQLIPMCRSVRHSMSQALPASCTLALASSNDMCYFSSGQALQRRRRGLLSCHVLVGMRLCCCVRSRLRKSYTITHVHSFISPTWNGLCIVNCPNVGLLLKDGST